MREYNIVFVDDEKEIIERIISVVKKQIMLDDGYSISFQILNDKEGIMRLPNISADIVLFDCAMGSAALDFGNSQQNVFGVELMKRFRENNMRTKIIFYSGSFSLKGSQCYDFTNEEMLYLINDLHVYKMVPKEITEIAKAIVDALKELDMIIMSMQDLRDEYCGEGTVVVDGKEYTVDDIIKELKNGSKLGEMFRDNVLKTVVTYFMKFGGDND